MSWINMNKIVGLFMIAKKLFILLNYETFTKRFIINYYSMKIVKIVLMTKNEKFLIKKWIQYHGEIFGYENLHIIDDSDDCDVLNYYKSISHLPIHFYRNNNNLNTLEVYINDVMKSIKNDCDFMIKLDTDEFISIYNKTKDISICKEIIRNSFDNLVINGYKYKCSYTMNALPLESREDPLEYIYFTQPWHTTFKTFFYSKTYLNCDLGSHVGTVISPYQQHGIENETNILIIHYHNQNFETYIENTKRAMISHKYIDSNDDIETQVKKISALYSLPIASGHKVKIYHRFLTDVDYKNKYYGQFNTPNKYRFDKLVKLFTNDKCIIITTINDPTQQILHYTNLIGWDLIIVGDSKTNDLAYKNINCIYLGLNEQKELFPTIYDKIPLKSYTRKMFGYLYAIKNKYKVIYDTDDDNKYTENINSFQNNFSLVNNSDFAGNDVKVENISFDYFKINDLKNTHDISHFTFDQRNNNLFLKYSDDLTKNTNENLISGIFRKEKLCSVTGFVNLYKIYTDSNIWPRGIPPNHQSIDLVPELIDTKSDMECVVIQGLVNNDPDVDAYYRININNNSFNFEKNQSYDVVLDKYSVCPFNTQNTFWKDTTMFYAMYLPVSVTFRYTDILRGFVALYQLWKNNKTIKFTFPTAIQERNIHDLNKDYESEVSMYNTAELVIELLNNNKDATIQEVYNILEKHDIVDKTEIDVLTEWLNLINTF